MNCQSASAASASLRDFVFGEFKDGGFLEQMAVEMANLVFAKRAALGHDVEKLFECFGEMTGSSTPVLSSSVNKLLRQQAGVLGEEAKDDAIEKAGDAEVLALRDNSLPRGSWRRPVRSASRFWSDLATSAIVPARFSVTCAVVRCGLRKSGSVNSGAEQAQIFRAVNLGVGELVRLLHRAVEIGADDVAVEIADDEQGRIQQRFAVAEQLLVGFVEIFLFAFVFPGEAALFPHVGKAAFVQLVDLPASFNLAGKSSASLTTRFWKQKIRCRSDRLRRALAGRARRKDH